MDYSLESLQENCFEKGREILPLKKKRQSLPKSPFIGISNATKKKKKSRDYLPSQEA